MIAIRILFSIIQNATGSRNRNLAHSHYNTKATNINVQTPYKRVYKYD